MKADALFVITAIVFVFMAWVATGGPSRPISSAGPFITPVTRVGEESQGYRTLTPPNPIDTSSYPLQIPGSSSSGSTEHLWYTRGDVPAGSKGLYLEHSSMGPASGNPNQEYVHVINSGATDVSLGGWRIEGRRAESSVSLPASMRLRPGERLTVVSGRSSANDVRHRICDGYATRCTFLNRNLELWANSRETITLRDPSGTIVDAFSY